MTEPYDYDEVPLAEVAGKLASEHVEVVCAACRSLGSMGPAAESVAPALLGLTKHQDSRIRVAALLTIGSIQSGACTKDVAQFLNDEQPAIQSAACASLAKIGHGAKPFGVMVEKLLDSTDKDVKTQALVYFRNMGMVSTGNGESIIKCLSDDDAVVREAAAAALTGSVNDIDPMVKDIAKHLASSFGGEKAAAAAVLGSLGEKAAGFIPEIATLLDDNFQDQNAILLAKTCKVSKPSVAMCIPKCAALQALSKIGPQGCKYADKVVALLADGCADVRQAAVEALGAMGAEGARYEGDVLKLFTDKDVRVVTAAIAAVGLMGNSQGGSNPSTIQDMVKMLRSQHPGVRSSAAVALGSMGDGVFVHIESLLKCFHDRAGQVRVAVIYALEKLGIRGQMYAADIVRAIFDADAKVRLAAINALGSMGERGAACMDDMVEALGDPDSGVRVATLRALANFGSDAYVWAQEVEAMQNDPVEAVRKAARETAKTIGA